MTTATNTENIISKINNLLNLAMDQGASEHERNLAQERAEKLMLKHQLDQADLTVEERSSVVEEVWDLSGIEYDFRRQLTGLIAAVVRHTGCKAATSLHNVRVVGFPANIAHAQMLWMISFSELSSHMFPKWDDKESFEDNVYKHVKAGFTWKQIHILAFDHGVAGMPDPYEGQRFSDGQLFPDHRLQYIADRGKCGSAYKRALKKRDEQWVKTSRHLAYRTSYIQSFASTIARRLQEMKRAAKTEMVDDADKYALAVQSDEAQVLAEFYRLYPQYDPNYQSEYWAKQDAKRAAKLQAMSPEARAAFLKREEKERVEAEKRYQKMRDSQYDSAGWTHGDKVAKNVNLNNDRAAGDKKKEIS